MIVKTHRNYMSPKLASPEKRLAPFVPALVPEGTTAPTFTGPISGTPHCFTRQGMPIEVMITNMAHVLIEGRPNPTLSWITVAFFTASEVRTIGALTELRATVSDNTGSVRVTQRP
jgi:hypothetical protein